MALIVAAAIVRDGRLLAARRCAGSFAGLWEFPGGKVEPGEDDRTALLRELREELAVSAVVGEQIGADWPLADGHRMHVYRTALPADQEPRCCEGCDALRWVGASETSSLSWIPADLPIVATVRRFLDA